MATLLDHSIGWATESSYGALPTPVTDHGEWLPGNSLDFDPNIKQGQGLRNGSKFDRSNRRVPVIGRVTGSCKFEMPTKGLGKLLKGAVGSGSSTLVSGSTYQQLFTPTQTNTFVDSFAFQERIVEAGGGVQLYNASGCTLTGFELAVAAGDLATVQFDIDGQRMHLTRTVADGATTSGSATLTSATAAFTPEDTGLPISGTGIPALTTILSVQSATSITLSANASATGTGVTVTIGAPEVTPSYPSGGTLFSARRGSATIGGTSLVVPTTTTLGSITAPTPLSIRDWSFKSESAPDVDRWLIGSRSQPTVGKRVATLTGTVDFDATTGRLLANAYRLQTPYPLLLQLDTLEALSTGYATLQLVIPNALIDSGAIPQPADDKVIPQSVQFAVLEDTSVAAFGYYLARRTADTAL